MVPRGSMVHGHEPVSGQGTNHEHPHVIRRQHSVDINPDLGHIRATDLDMALSSIVGHGNSLRRSNLESRPLLILGQDLGRSCVWAACLGASSHLPKLLAAAHLPDSTGL